MSENVVTKFYKQLDDGGELTKIETAIARKKLPPIAGSFNHLESADALYDYFSNLAITSGVTERVTEYIHTLGTVPVNNAYIGGVYSPVQNRIYLVPQAQANEAGKNWHYIDCNTGIVTEYIHTLGTNPLNNAYIGGAYSPNQNRIYFCPHAQSNIAGKNWHYIDCDTGNVVEYIHTLGTMPAALAYSGACYSPTQDRIYFVPYSQADEAGKNWHYIDCTTGNVIEYIHTLGTLPVNNAYIGSCYSPSQNRIYFAPNSQGNNAGKNWHYIDCDTGNAVEYIHTLTLLPLSVAYRGAAFSPIQNRIYFVPFGQASTNAKKWHYIDCDTGIVTEYVHTLVTLPVSGAYRGAVYSPIQNRIYFVPHNQADEAGKNWHYIDCNTGNVMEYIHTLGTLPINSGYSGGCYSPTENKVYYVPQTQANEAGKNWHSITLPFEKNIKVSSEIMSLAMFNNNE